MLLNGALTRSGDAVQASLNLVDANRNRIRWGAQREGSDLSFSALAAQLAEEVTGAMGASPPKLYESPYYLQGTPAMAATPEMTEAKNSLIRIEDAPAHHIAGGQTADCRALGSASLN